MVTFKNGAYQARGFDGVLEAVRDMPFHEKTMVRLLDAPEGKVPDCGRLASDLDDKGYDVTIMQEDRSSMPDYLTVIKKGDRTK